MGVYVKGEARIGTNRSSASMASTSFVPPPSPSPNLRTLLAYRDAQNELDLAKILDLFDDNLQYQVLPKSLGMPVLNKEQHKEVLAGVIRQFKAFYVSVTVEGCQDGFDRWLISSLAPVDLA